MISKKIEFSYTEVESLLQLSTAEQQLAAAAIRAAQTAYAPYSNFCVGAAVMLDNGTIVTGSNQENIAYPSGLCAERVGLFAAASQHSSSAPRTIAVAALKNGRLTPQPVSPCGACRQVFAETEKRYSTPLSLLLVGNEKTVKIASASSLLPLAFEL